MKSLTPGPKLGTMLIMGEMHPIIKPSYTPYPHLGITNHSQIHILLLQKSSNKSMFYCCKNHQTNPHFIVAKIIKQIHVFVVANLQTDPCFGCCKFHTNSEIR
jgi:hypothetical protein